MKNLKYVLIVISILFCISIYFNLSQLKIIDRLNNRIEVSMIKNNLLRNSLRKNNKPIKVNEQKNKIKECTDEEALEYLKDYYSFYKEDFIYRNPKVRKRGPNNFQISLEETSSKKEFQEEFFWDHQVYRLIVHENGEYDIYNYPHF